MARPTSYGVLLFRRGEEGIRFLLGKIPQGRLQSVGAINLNRYNVSYSPPTRLAITTLPFSL